MGIFVTYNPGYMGRNELHDNLKILCRPIAMVIPEYRHVAENLLFSEGFYQASELSVKISIIYKLCSDRLTFVNHYDFGMRSMCSVLKVAGNLKRADKSVNESSIFYRALIDCNVPKLIQQDIPIFKSLVQDFFMGQQAY